MTTKKTEAAKRRKVQNDKLQARMVARRQVLKAQLVQLTDTRKTVSAALRAMQANYNRLSKKLDQVTRKRNRVAYDLGKLSKRTTVPK